MPSHSEPAGDAGIFETLAVIEGRPRLLERHLARLFEGCGRLHIPEPPAPRLLGKISEQAAIPGTGVVKIIVRQRPCADESSPWWSVAAEPPRLRPPEWARDG